jgi:G3E family GTPase
LQRSTPWSQWSTLFVSFQNSTPPSSYKIASAKKRCPTKIISDLFADQIEFANVVVVNKVDRTDARTLGRVKSYIKTLNPTARIIEAKYSKVDVREMLNTGVFNFAEAVTSPGWLKSLHEMTVMDVQGKKRLAPKPETLELVGRPFS